MSSKIGMLGHGLPSTVEKTGEHPREASGGAFTIFTPPQIKQFKEAFNMIDQDGDGRVTEKDLKLMLSNLGQTPRPDLLQSLLLSGPRDVSLDEAANAKPGVNFTQFLTMMGEHLRELDPEPDLLDAFSCFDENDKGVVDIREMRKWLGEYGDRLEDWEIDRLFSGQFADRQGRFNYVEFAKVLRVNDGEEERDDRLAS